MAEKLMVLEGKRVILNAQYSKVGNCYPRLFIEATPEQYINADLTIGTAFRMEKKDFHDWLEDAETILEAQHDQVLTDYNIVPEALRDYLRGL